MGRGDGGRNSAKGKALFSRQPSSSNSTVVREGGKAEISRPLVVGYAVREENGYFDHHLVTKIGYCDYFPFNILPRHKEDLSHYDNYRIWGLFCPGTKVVTISVFYLYRAEKKSLYMVARYFFLALFSFSAWPCLAVA